MKFTPSFSRPARRTNGSITVVFIALLGIMMILVMAESRALFHLHREVKFLEQQQTNRLHRAQVAAPAATLPEGK